MGNYIKNAIISHTECCVFTAIDFLRAKIAHICYTIAMTVIHGTFEWDSEKDEINKAKHGFSFSEILDIFDDPFFLERYDAEHSTLEEERYIGLGESGGAVIVMTAYTERERTRIISARFATDAERNLYYDARKNS